MLVKYADLCVSIRIPVAWRRVSIAMQDATLHRYQGGSVARVHHAAQSQRPDPTTTQRKHILSASDPQPLQSSPPGISSHEFISVDKDSLLDAAIGEMSHPLLASLRRGSPRDWSPSKTSPTTTRKDPSDAQSRWKVSSRHLS